MQRNLSYLAALPVLALTLTLSAQKKKIDRSALPAAVEKTLQTQSVGSTIKAINTDRENGKTIYEVEMIFQGHTKDIEIAADGALNEIEEEIAFNTLPADVQKALTAKAAGARITKVETLTKHDKLVAYEAATLQGTKKGEIQVGPNGGKLAHAE